MKPASSSSSSLWLEWRQCRWDWYEKQFKGGTGGNQQCWSDALPAALIIIIIVIITINIDITIIIIVIIIIIITIMEVWVAGNQKWWWSRVGGEGAAQRSSSQRIGPRSNCDDANYPQSCKMSQIILLEIFALCKTFDILQLWSEYTSPHCQLYHW